MPNPTKINPIPMTILFHSDPALLRLDSPNFLPIFSNAKVKIPVPSKHAVSNGLLMTAHAVMKYH
jgi:hypothetical protein